MIEIKINFLNKCLGKLSINMKIDTNTVLILIIGVVAAYLFIQYCACSAEKFGQDASIRASVGWIAGPKGMYGYDPIDHFAQQIAQMKRRPGVDLMSDPGQVVPMPTIENHAPWKMDLESFEYSPKECKSCMTTEEFEHAQ